MHGADWARSRWTTATVGRSLSASPDVAEHVVFAPPLAEVPLPARNVAALLQAQRSPSPALPAAPPFASATGCGPTPSSSSRPSDLPRSYRARLDPDRPPHVGVLLDNTPDYVFALCGAGLVGATRGRAEPHPARRAPGSRHLAHRCPAPDHRAPPSGAARARCRSGWICRAASSSRSVSPTPTIHPVDGRVVGRCARRAAADRRRASDGPERSIRARVRARTSCGRCCSPRAPRPRRRRCAAPSADCSRRASGWPRCSSIGPDDVGYAAMPLFHANSLMSGLAPALVAGASLSLARRFSASRFLPDVRHYGATWFNYTGKLLAYLLATPERDDDADNTLQDRLRQRRVTACRRGGRRALRHQHHRRLRLHRRCDRPGSLGRPAPRLGRAPARGDPVVDADGDEAPRARFDARGPPGQRRGVRG